MSRIIEAKAGDTMLLRVANSPLRPSEDHSKLRPASDTANDMSDGSVSTPSSCNYVIQHTWVGSEHNTTTSRWARPEDVRRHNLSMHSEVRTSNSPIKFGYESSL